MVAGCPNTHLAPWWRLCTTCTLPLLKSPATNVSQHDQAIAAGWDSLTWAERIAPNHWGSARSSDPWIQAQRCLVFAAGVTGHGTGCPHIATPQIPTPVICVARNMDHQACPLCAEPHVAHNASFPGACDRCGQRPVHLADRCALTTGTSLIIVAQLCSTCRSQVFELADELHPDGLT
ncbi:hypothetical protein [Kineosporia sp. NBRC 101677]|uniref:hypothetical protein n=1 Tax=Kineosporia sp. NBRC 101677 TaxID=3032197 RepID=UPI002556F550|nr:hypothetical protein [Kineosporia sp. NBRC 101677]